MPRVTSLVFVPVLSVTVLLAGCAAERAGNPGHEPRTAYGPDHHILIAAEDVEWRSGPASLPEGARYALLEGDPAEDGMFVMRLKLPDGYTIPPHTHPNVERVTVLSGVFNLGHGAQMRRERAMRLPEGSFTSMPAGMRHFAFTEGETVVQLTSFGPWDIEYLDPADDPRR